MRQFPTWLLTGLFGFPRRRHALSRHACTPVPPDAAAADAADHLSRVHGVRGLQAAILALLLPPGQPRAALAWEAEVAGNARGGAILRAHVE